MKKIIKSLCLSMLAVACVLFAACGGAGVIWEADFTKGNQNIFGVYGTVTENKEQGYVTLSPEEGENYSSSSYFGQNTEKNFAWNKGGMTVSLTLGINHQDLEGKHLVWSLALNETDKTYITELPTFFIGDSEGVYFLYKFTGVENDYDALKNDEKAVKLADGKYTVNYTFTVNDNDELQLKVTLTNASNAEVFKSENNDVTVIDHAGYEAGTKVKQENVAGLRYLWLARANASVNVYGLKVTK